jgi:hypothetical protein
MKVKNDQMRELLLSRLYNPHDEPPEEQVIFRIQFQNIGSLGNFSLLTGLPKAGKGKYISGFTAAGITRQETFGMSVKLPEGKTRISYWDTEQSKHDHHKMMKLIKQLSDCEDFPDSFNAFHCRRDSAQQIMDMIKYYLTLYPDTGIVIIDGLLDMIDSFNDERQSKLLVNFLKEITDVYNLFVLAVLHRSKSVDKSMGHLGSAADRAAQSVLVVEKNKETKRYILKAEYLRNGDDFTPLEIFYNPQLSIWQQGDYTPQETPVKRSGSYQASPREYDEEQHRANSVRIFLQGQYQDYKTIIENIRVIYAVGDRWARQCLSFLLERGHVFKSEQGYTNIRQTKLTIAT